MLGNYLKIRVMIFFTLFFSVSYSQNNIVKDVDGNVYKIVEIGNQIWMQENLKVGHFNNGDSIETTNPDTINLTTAINPKYFWIYNNDDSINDIYGKIYTWYVVNDKRNVCPTGWHVPTDEEFCILENFLEPNIDNNCNKIEHRGFYIGNYLKESGHLHWGDPETGANNLSKFNALPYVIRTFDGKFRYFGLYSYFWTSSEYDSKQAFSRRLYHNTSDISRSYYFKKDALSVRCVKD